MAAKYALTVQVETYDFNGEFYLLGEGHDTPGDVLEYVAKDHILRIDQARHVGSYLMNVLKTGDNASDSEYKAWDSDIDCGIHADISHQRFSFWAGDEMVKFTQPTETQIAKKADELR